MSWGGSWGNLSPAQEAVLKKHVEGRHVHDLGAGNCEMALALVRLGAEKVTAVDKEPMPAVPEGRILRVRTYFDRISDRPDVAFISWPANKSDGGLLNLVRRAGTVVYLGKNTDGSWCGWPSLFEEFLRHEVIDHVPDRANTMIVYGKRLKERRVSPTAEEAAALGVLVSDIVPYIEVDAV